MVLYFYFCHNKRNNTYFSTLSVLDSGEVVYASQTNYNSKFKLFEAISQIANRENATLTEYRNTDVNELWAYTYK